MDRIARNGLTLLLFSACGLLGCSKGDAPGAASNTQASGTSTQSAPPTDPAGRVAYDFLAAVVKGDDQRVSACLTPKAIERIVASQQRFALPGVESTTFRIGEIRKPTETQALVQCILTDTSKADQTQSEEICCLVRQVEAGWRVSGIAYYTSPDRPPTIMDFESAPSESMGMPVTSQPETGTGGPNTPQRPSPTRTAEEQQSPSFR